MKRLRKREPRAIGLLLGITGLAMWLMMNLSVSPIRVATASPGATPEIHTATASAFATFTVTSTADIGLNTLRQAILDANGNADPSNTINFNLPVGSTITLTTGQLPAITKDLTITGPGANSLTISGNNAQRVFAITSGVTVTISGLTIMNGAGGIESGGLVTITNCTLSNNSTLGSGGGIRNNGGTVTISNSTLSNNSSTNGGAFANNGGTVTIINSTLSGNTSINGTGGAIVIDSGTANIINSTLIGNSALNNTGGGFRNFGTVNIKNSILNNPSGGDCSNLGTVNASGVNFSTDGTCPGFIQVTAMQLNLGPLQNNGGTTQTHALLSGSVAIDTVTDCTDVGGNPISTDQRGVLRPLDGDSNGILLCDAGSYEAPLCTTVTPTITCPANVTQANDPSQCGAVVTYPNPTITDDCPGSFTTTCVPVSGSFFAVGTTTVNCSINTGGNKASAAPNGGNCPTTITHSTSQVVTPGNSISCNNEFGHSDNSYWRAFNLPSFSITNPFAVQSVDIGIEDASSSGSGQKGKGARFSRSAKSARTKAPNGAGQPLTVRLYTNTGGAFPDGTRNLLATANFTISDQSGTIMNLPISANVPAGSELVVEIFTPSGEVEGNYFFIGSNAATETGTSYLSALECGASIPTPTAELGAPNMHIVMNVNGCEAPPGSACSFTVTVQDTQAPTITCPGDFTQSTDPNQCAAVVEYTPPGTSDNCPCAGTGTGVQLPDGESGCAVICMPPTGAIFPKGTTTITCTATDASGNQSLPCTFSVTIADTQPPTITCPANQIAPTPDGNPVTVTYTAPTVTDNCSLSCQSSAAKPAGEDCAPGTVSCTPPSGSTFSVGTTTVSCTACDCAGNSASCSFTVTVTPCIITCPVNISRANDPNQCGAVVPFAPNATAGCGTVTCSPASGSFFPVGTTTVTCTTSAGPNCSFTVTIADTQAPAITCPVNVTAVTPICGGITSVVNFTAPTASDNCPGVTVACVPPSGTILPVGTTSVTCTATDAAGNTATCSFTVSLFNACLQDDNNPNSVLVWNIQTGEYRFCCNGSIFTGIGIVSNKGGVRTLNHISSDRRVSGKLDCATRRGEGGLQTPAGNLRCSISDRDIGNNSCSCGAPVNSASK